MSGPWRVSVSPEWMESPYYAMRYRVISVGSGYDVSWIEARITKLEEESCYSPREVRELEDERMHDAWIKLLEELQQYC